MRELDFWQFPLKAEAVLYPLNDIADRIPNARESAFDTVPLVADSGFDGFYGIRHAFFCVIPFLFDCISNSGNDGGDPAFDVIPFLADDLPCLLDSTGHGVFSGFPFVFDGVGNGSEDRRQRVFDARPHFADKSGDKRHSRADAVIYFVPRALNDLLAVLPYEGERQSDNLHRARNDTSNEFESELDNVLYVFPSCRT